MEALKSKGKEPMWQLKVERPTKWTVFIVFVLLWYVGTWLVSLTDQVKWAG